MKYPATELAIVERAYTSDVGVAASLLSQCLVTPCNLLMQHPVALMLWVFLIKHVVLGLPWWSNG